MNCSMRTALLCAVAGAVFPVASQAQTNDAVTALDEVVVTAQRRETRLEDTPLAISALTGRALQEKQVTTLQDLAGALPNLDIARATSTTLLAVRGVGSVDSNVATESRVATHIDGVYIGRPWQVMMQLMDMERIEYLRGPQGTLYGRNATAGALNFISRDPNFDYNGYVTLGFGNYDARRAEAAVNIPFNDQWAARVALAYNSHDGFDRDIISGRGVNDLETGAVRAKIRYDSEAFKLVLSGEYGKEDDNSGATVYWADASPGVPLVGPLFGGVVSPPPNIATDDLGFPSTRREYVGASAHATWRFGGNDVTAIVGYRDSESRAGFDGDLTSARLLRVSLAEDAEQFSGELRFHRGTEQYDLLAGAYYYHEEINGSTGTPLPLILFGGPPGVLVQGIESGGEVKTKAYAAFAQLRWNFTPEFYVEVGGRYSYEKKTIDEGTQFDVTRLYSPSNPAIFFLTNKDAESWSSFDPRGTIGYQPSSNLHFYATIASGFKSGGFNLGGLQAPFDPEELMDYEAGVKFTSDDRRLSLNASAFYYKYKNMQVFKISDFLLSVENAARATIKGIELEGRWAATENLQVGASLDLLDGEYDEFTSRDEARPTLGEIDLAGNRLPQAPRYRTRFDITYSWQVGEGELSVRAEGSWTDRVFFSQFQRNILSAAPSSDFNAFLNYNTGDWALQVFGRNLTDHRKLVYANVGAAANGFPVIGALGAPRTYGVSVTRRW